MVDGYGQNDLVAVDEAKGYTCGISGTMGFCCRRGNYDKSQTRRCENSLVKKSAE
jgi:hypothetical protein